MHHGHRPHHIHVGHGTTANVNKTGTSITQKVGGALTVTNGSSGGTVTTTTPLGSGTSVTTQTRNGHTHPHVNKKKWFFGLF